MLQFIFGRAGTGKTTRMLSMLEDCVINGNEAVLIVPEQFSFDTEKEVLHKLGDKNAMLVSVMSFTRVCDEVERVTGGGCGTLLTDGKKLILLNRALNSASPDLKLWGRYISSSGFTSSLLDTIEEFKLHAITPDVLQNAALNSDNASLIAKIHDISVIYTHYNSLINERFIDPTDRLTKLYDKLLDYRYFEGKTVFVDSFNGFTGQQYRIFERIFAQAKDVIICMTDAVDNKKPFNIFENIRKAVENIKKIAKSHAVNCKEDIILEKDYFNSRSISAVEKLLSRSDVPKIEADDKLNICVASTVYDEADFAARTIKKLVREENYRFRDFVIIARETERYEEAVAAACEKNGVSCFFDRRMPLGACVPAVGLCAAFEAIEHYNTEHILRFLKSGIGTLTLDEISDLENYCFLWDINGKKWFDKWDMNPIGFATKDDPKYDETKNIQLLNKLNDIRERVIEPFKMLENGLKGTARDMCSAVMKFFDICNAKQALQKIRKSLLDDDKNTDADILRQSWDALIDILNSFVECYGDQEIKCNDFYESLKKSIALSDIGVTPQMLDQVSFGAANRICPSKPKVALILGANLGVFPKNIGINGVFGAVERKMLIKLNVEIPDCGILAAIDEDFLVYSNLCCATDRLYISYCVMNSSGSDCEPSVFVSEIKEKIPCKVFNEPDNLRLDNLPETALSAFSDGCLRYSYNKSEGMTLLSSLNEKDEYSEKIRNVLSLTSRREDILSQKTAEKLFKKDIKMSASRFDVYHHCKFRHFCQFGLNISRPQRVDFSANQRGLIVHYALQKLIEKYHKDIAITPDNEVCETVELAVKEYLESIPGYYSSETEYMRFLIENIIRSIKDVALHLKKEFAQSKFEPKYCEFSFGKRDSEPITIPYEKGKINLNGMIDRIDVYDSYIRIVDYKTGTKVFKLSDIIVGQNIQMLMYLYAILQKEEFSKMQPAGILYLPAKREKGDEKKLRMNGLIKGEESLVRAMEEENAGIFIPKYKLNSKNVLDRYSAPYFIPDKGFETIFDFIEQSLKDTALDMLSGDISVDPIDGLGGGGSACKYCDFAAVCRIEEEACKKATAYTNEEVLKILSGEEVKEDGEV
ncbi:MAG: hypothetical protein E7562_06355 [Ruminococcaceae bacterium]|nr:hypothetical protein [Oscillospiraceae bacterium]